MPACEPGEAFAEEPHSERPGQRRSECEAGCAWDDQSQPECQLNRREGHVPRDGMCRDHVGGPVHRAGDEMRLPVAARVDDLPRKPRPEHEGLELQGAVEQPERSKRDLQLPASHANRLISGRD